MKKKGAKTKADLDWENRTLCSDESCIGVIGSDGRCRICSLAFGSDVPQAAANDTHTEAAEAVEATVDAETDEDVAAEPHDDTDWESRILCSDENCIGVIGPDGRCKECGLAHPTQ